ncbi:MAG: PspA/IM30 family protein [Armatimonadetes bacterium]|jgi:phage shock protein A|nr:PspA/IM30 family protein [Armatimonadota bacterium]
MKRFFRWLKALFNRGMDRLEDPDIMLDQARREMQENLAANREKAVQAITQKNRLQIMLEDARKRSADLEAKAAMALRQGNRDLARTFIREKANNDAVIASLEQSYQQAVQTVEAVKVAIKRQEEEVRKKTAEALAMKAQWKQAQIQNSIAKALDGLTFESSFGSFEAAQERIREAQSEAAARQEMHATSLQGKVMAMEDQAMDYQAEEELQKLEERLGLRQPAAQEAEVQTVQPVGPGAQPTELPKPQEVPASEVDQQLEELEKRLGGNEGGKPAF